MDNKELFELSRKRISFSIEKQNALVLVEKIKYLIDNKTEATELGKNGRERILNEFNSQIMINKMLELYNEIVL